jgi:hypothetical protein
VSPVGAMDERVSIRAHFERFPATVKGAFVLRGADRDPHQVRIDAARVREISGRGGLPIDLDAITLDVAPHLDLFVPFEFAITELQAGWYGLECEVVIDGTPANVRPPKRFAMPWPRGSIRRGNVRVNRSVQVDGGPKVRVEQVECGGDSIRVSYSVAPVEEVVIRLSGDGAPVPILETELQEEDGRGRLTAYPLLRTQSRLEIDVKGASATLDVRLP